MSIIHENREGDEYLVKVISTLKLIFADAEPGTPLTEKEERVNVPRESSSL